MSDYATIMNIVFKPAYQDTYEKAEFEIQLGQMFNTTISLGTLDPNRIAK